MKGPLQPIFCYCLMKEENRKAIRGANAPLMLGKGRDTLPMFHGKCLLSMSISFSKVNPSNGRPRNVKGEMLRVREQSNRAQVCSVTNTSACVTF